MRQLFKIILAILFIFLLIVFGLSVYLSPNDLAECSKQPSNLVGAEKCRRADAIIAISGGDTTARANSAIELYEDGWADKIIFSGAAADTNGPSNAKVMRDLALEAGVPAEAILLDETSKNTAENAENVAQILKNNHWYNVILTTSSYHLRRASLLFQAQNSDLQLRTVAADDSMWDMLWWLSPYGWYLVFSEIGGIILFYSTGASSGLNLGFVI